MAEHYLHQTANHLLHSRPSSATERVIPGQADPGTRPRHTMKLYYFGMPGRAEAARIMLSTKDRAFSDVEFTGEEWGAKYKAMSPNGMAPFLELDDGTLLTQTSAINRYVARLTSYYPDDILAGARTDELVMNMDDVRLCISLCCIDCTCTGLAIAAFDVSNAAPVATSDTYNTACSGPPAYHDSIVDH